MKLETMRSKIFTKKTAEHILRALLFAALPIIMCLIKIVLVDHQSPYHVWPGASIWNDELLYYKQVEAMVRSGIPKGFFGYNESSALVGSFGAWSPLILLPYAIWGWLFDWYESSAYMANLFFLSLSFFLFGMLTKPSKKETLKVSVLMLAFTVPISRYIFSIMPEISCLSLCVVFFGLIVGCKRGFRDNYLKWMSLIAFYLVLMRPYFALLYLYPIWFVFRQKKSKALRPIADMVSALVIYGLISVYFLAPYFEDVYNKNVLEHGIKGVFVTFFANLKDMLHVCALGLSEGLGWGLYFNAAIVAAAVLLICGFFLLKKNKDMSGICFITFLNIAGVLSAVLLMYSIMDGWRHMFIYIVVGTLVIAFVEDRRLIPSAAMLISGIVLFVVLAKDPEFFKAPYRDDTYADIHEMEKEIGPQMSLSEEPGWDNVVILAYNDKDSNGSFPLSAWQYAYALPRGFAISYCNYDYLNNNTDLQSKYIMVPTWGELTANFSRAGKKQLFSDENITLYQLR